MNVTEDAVVANPVFPETAERSTVKRLANAAGIGETDHAVAWKRDDAAGICGSSFNRSFRAGASISICQAKLALHFLKSVGVAGSCAEICETILCNKQIFHVSEVLVQCVQNIVGLAATSVLAKLVKPGFHLFGKYNG